MQKTKFKTILSCILCFVLIAAAALALNACAKKTGGAEAPDTSEPPKAADTVSGVPIATEESAELITEIGEGKTQFDFSVVFADGTKKYYAVSTDKKTVGEALLELGLIAGDEGPYGLYVKTVDGVTVDYDKDGKYWAFYENDTMASAGVDMTEIKEGESYAFKVSK